MKSFSQLGYLLMKRDLRATHTADRRKHTATPKKNVEKTIISAVVAEPYCGRTWRYTTNGRVKNKAAPKMCDHMFTTTH